MLANDAIDVKVEPPHLVIDIELSAPMSDSLRLEYDLDEVIEINTPDDGDVTIVDSHWHGVVVEGPDDTHHIDLREVNND